jgi:exosome complex component RRP42
MSNEQKNYVLKSLKDGIRADGRQLLEYRKIEVESHISANAEGSARVKIGDTEVLVGVKLGVEKPYPDTPEEGGLMAGVELLPLSSPDFESGPPPVEAVEYSRLVDRAIREGHAFDNKKLCIKKGEKAWFVSIDVCPINAAGNLFDSTSLGALLALKNAKFPGYDEETGAIDYKHPSTKPLPMHAAPINVTVFKIGDFFIIDPTDEEEKLSDARLTVAVLEDNKICAMQKGGETSLMDEDIIKMIDIAVEKSKDLRKFVK